MVRRRAENGTYYHEPPYTDAEEMELYRRPQLYEWRPHENDRLRKICLKAEVWQSPPKCSHVRRGPFGHAPQSSASQVFAGQFAKASAPAERNGSLNLLRNRALHRAIADLYAALRQ